MWVGAGEGGREWDEGRVGECEWGMMGDRGGERAGVVVQLSVNCAS